MGEHAEQKKYNSGHWPRKVTIFFCGKPNPMKSNKSQSKLSNPSRIKSLASTAGLKKDPIPKWNVGKEESPRVKRDVTGPNNEATKKSKTIFLEKVENLVHDYYIE